MTTLIHLSDLHFGPKHNNRLDDLILEDISSVKPDLIILSGDFTMRAQVSEYEQARAFIEKLSAPVLTIPGNHDQPLSLGAAYERLSQPYNRYSQHIRAMTNATQSVPGLFVVGVNDNHPIIPGGMWSGSLRQWIAKELNGAPLGSARVLVTHHQIYWDGKYRPFGIWFPTEKLNWLASLSVELILNGHTHVPLNVQTPQGIVIAQAGTAMSGRTRHGYGNAYNCIEITDEAITVFIQTYDAEKDQFETRNKTVYPRKLKPVPHLKAKP